MNYNSEMVPRMAPKNITPTSKNHQEPSQYYCRCAESNRRPFDYESTALPTELQRLVIKYTEAWGALQLCLGRFDGGVHDCAAGPVHEIFFG